jgi:hypothetical protein
MATYSSTIGSKDHSSMIGGFGMYDVVDPAEQCAECVRGTSRPTDLFCKDHDRFLPLIHWVSAARVGIVLTGATLIYALFWLTAELKSSIPVLLAVGTIGLVACTLPLRTHRRTVWLSALAYLISFGVVFLGHVTENGARYDLIVAAFFAALAILALYMIYMLHAEASASEAILEHGPSNGLVELGVIPLVIAMVAGLAWILTPLFLDHASAGHVRADESVVVFIGLCLMLMVSGGVGVVEGLGSVSGNAPGFPLPLQARRVTWRARFGTIQRRRTNTMIDRIGELTKITIIRMADALRVILVTTARVAVNALLELVHLLARLVILAINLLIKLIFVLVKAIIAVAVCFLEAAVKLLVIGISFGGISFGALVLPVAALLGAEALSVLLAEHARRYLLDGAMNDLWWFVLQSVAALALISAAWILMADQRLRLSLRSAYRSAGIAGPYLLVFIAIGGWLFTALSFLGLGHIRAGWTTWTTTAVLVGAFVWSQFLRRDDSTPD